MEYEPGDAAEPTEKPMQRDKPLLPWLSASFPWFGPPGVMALYSRFPRRYPFDIRSPRVLLTLGVVFVLLTAYVLGTREPIGRLAITTVPAVTCRVEVSALCASNPIPWAGVRINGRDRPSMDVTSGADGRVEVELPAGHYDVDPSSVGNLVGAGYAEAEVTVGQTTEVTVAYFRP